MLVKSFAGACLRRFGYHAVRLEALPTMNFARHLRRVLSSQDIDTVLDVGANKGQFRDFLMNDVGFRGRVLSFEPVSHLYKLLAARAACDQRWHVYPFALGERHETLTINVMTGDDWSSFLEPQMQQATRFHDLNTVARTEAVQVHTLDDIYPDVAREHGVERGYLKLDTQGFDLRALRGGTSVLPRLVALQTEAVAIPLYSGMPRYPEVIGYLESRGFALSGMFPVSIDDHLRIGEFDCVMVNPAQVRQVRD